MNATTAKNEAISSKSVPIAIIGMGCLFPKSNSNEAFWSNINNCIDCITDIPSTHWSPDDYYDADPSKRDHTYAKRGGFISSVEFNPLEFGISPRDIEAIDTTQLLGMVVAKQAMRDAGYDDKREFSRKRTSVILGVTGALELVVTLGTRLGFPKWKKALKDAGVSDAVAADVVERISNSYVDWQENSFPGLLGNVAAGRIANRLNLGGTNCVVDAACASSITALHMASLELAAHRSDMVVTGGFDTFNDIFMYMCFSKTPALSPTGNAKPFDNAADGTIIGEGLGALVLKRLDDAVRDKDRVYAVIRGIGTSSDGKGNAVYAPSMEGQSRALADAYEQAGISPDTIELVEAHGTGTKVGDSIEIQALTKVYRDTDANRTWCAIGSVKSQIGHTKAAAGVAGIIKATLSLYHKVLPPTIKITRPNEHIEPGKSPFYLNTIKRPWMPVGTHPRRAAVSAFGFGGSNFHCVLEEFEKEKPQIDWDGRVQILAFSAATHAELKQQIGEFPADLNWDKLRLQAAVSRRAFDSKKPFRLSMVIERDHGNIKDLFEKILQRLNSDETAKSWHTPDGIYYSAERTPGKLGILFSGQGSQYVGMLRDLVCQFPVMHQTLAEANNIFSQLKDAVTARRLSDFIYPHPEFSDDERKRNEDALRNTRIAQPALGAIGVGLFKLLQQFGVKPEALAGHSYGELLALCAGDSIKEKALHLLSNIRGQLMAEKSNEEGSMLAVQSGPEDTAELLQREGIQLTIANKNAPNQTVLSGALREIQKAMAFFERRKIRNKLLNVSAAFHSNLVELAQKPFEDALKKVKLNISSIPVYSNITALPYPKNMTEARSLLANQLTRPVEFIQQIENMYSSGVRTFLEVGPNQQLTGLVKSIMKERASSTLAIDIHLGKRTALVGLGLVLAHLSALGYALNLDQWDNNFKGAEDAKGSYAVTLTGANSFTPKKNIPPTVTTVDAQTAAMASHPTPPLLSPSEAPMVSADLHSTGASRFSRISQSQSSPARSSSAGSVINKSKNQQQSKSMKSENPQTNFSHRNPDPATGDSTMLREAITLTQKNLLALQEMQTQTADLHRRFLHGQETAQRSFQSLIDQQRELLLGLNPNEMNFASQPISTNRRRAENETLTTSLSGNRSHTRDNDFDKLPTSIPNSMIETRGSTASTARPSNSSPTHKGNASPAATLARTENSASNVENILLQLVSEKTGYPIETLNLDMGLDTDLGIDSIKRVEILSALQVKLPSAQVIGPEHMGTLHTLKQIIQYLSSDGNQKQGVTMAASTLKSKSNSPPGLDEKLVSSTLLSVVSDKTGYPIETLNLGLGLDTDLGIDSIKRVEILSALQEQLPQAPTIGPEHLGTLHTLNAIVEFICASVPAPNRDEPTPATKGQGNQVKGVGTLDHQQIATTLLQIVSDKTGYPVEMLNLEMGLDSDLGIDSIKRVEILSALQEKVHGIPAFSSDQIGVFRNLFQIVDHIIAVTSNGSQSPAPESLENLIPDFVDVRAAKSELPLQRLTLELADMNELRIREKVKLQSNARLVVTDNGSILAQSIVTELKTLGYLAELIKVDEYMAKNTSFTDVDGLVIISPTAGAHDGFLKNAFKLAKLFGVSQQEKISSKEGALFITISRMDGRFGINGMNGQSDPFSGGLAGLLKTAHHEWPHVQCKAVDVNVFDETEPEMGIIIVDEILHSGPLEVGIAAGNQRVCLQLIPSPNSDKPTSAPINPGDVIVVTGGARGVTVEIALAMAKAWKPTLILLGRSPEPKAEPAWLKGLTEEAQIKRALVSQNGKNLSPKKIESEYRGILANREISANLKRIEALSAVKVYYHSVDVRNERQVKKMMDTIKKTHGPIAGVVHGAGVIADRRIEDKTDEMFDSVYETKVIGLQRILTLIDPTELKILALFSSSTGRFGRTGQVDYAVANEVLNKIGQLHAKQLQNCRVVSFNWGPWEGGMVNPALRKVFAQEGVSLIPLAAGAEFFINEFSVNGVKPVEVVVLGPAERKLEISNVIASVPSEPKSSTACEVVMKRTLSVKEYPVLKSHVLDGKAVMPMAMMIEFIGLTACHAHPGLNFIGFDDLKINSRLSLSEDESITVLMKAGKICRQMAQFFVPVQLCRQADDNEVIHAHANILLGNKYESSSANLNLPVMDRYPAKGNIYRQGRLFHGEDLFGLEKIEGISVEGMAAWSRSAPAPSAWIENPLRSNWLADPLVLDSSFQMMILWSLEFDQVPSLPVAIGNYRQYRANYPAEGVKIDIRINQKVGALVYADMEFSDQQGQIVARIENYICSQNQSLIESFRHNKLTLIA